MRYDSGHPRAGVADTIICGLSLGAVLLLFLYRVNARDNVGRDPLGPNA